MTTGEGGEGSGRGEGAAGGKVVIDNALYPLLTGGLRL